MKYILFIFCLVVSVSGQILPYRTSVFQAFDPTNTVASYTRDGLVGEWLFDEGSGTTASDTSGNGNDGTFSASGLSWLDLGSGNYAVSFTRSLGGVITVPDSAVLDGYSAMSFVIRFRQTTAASKAEPRGLLSKRTSSSSSDYSYTIFGYDVDLINVDINDSTDRGAATTTTGISTWITLTVVFDGTLTSSSRTKIYRDGVLDATLSEGSTSVLASVATLEIGGLGGSTASYFDGDIDAVLIYNRALTTTEIEELHTYFTN